MKAAEETLRSMVAGYSDTTDAVKPIVYVSSRIKSVNSITEKLKKRGLPTTAEAAITSLYDAVGVRIVCAFNEDVYRVVEWLTHRDEIEVVQTKDYIAYPKPNGYRSYHMLLRLNEGEGKGLPAEIQIRTIAIDFWATLEHQMKYKRNVRHEKMVREELKRCADEIASLDLSMQTIRDILREEE